MFPTASELLDAYYYGKAERDRVKQQAHDLERLLKNEYQKNIRKLKKLEQTLTQAEEATQFQKIGELLTANIHTIKRGMTEIDVVDYYDEAGGTITIELDLQKTPSENAQWYFKKYQKAKTARLEVVDQLVKTEQELAYLESLIQQMDSASPRDVEEIREELMQEGILKSVSNKGKRKRSKQLTQPLNVISHQLELSFSSAKITVRMTILRIDWLVKTRFGCIQKRFQVHMLSFGTWT